MIPQRTRKQGLFRRVRRYPFAEGIVGAWDISVDAGPAAKTIIFESRAAMRRFYDGIRRLGIGISARDGLGGRCCGFVNSMTFTVMDPETMETTYTVVDRRYFCIVGLVEGLLTQEYLTHEASHVGFAHARRSGAASPFRDENNAEEVVCYPAGRWADQVMLVIEQNNLRTHGGDGKRARLSGR